MGLWGRERKWDSDSSKGISTSEGLRIGGARKTGES